MFAAIDPFLLLIVGSAAAGAAFTVCVVMATRDAVARRTAREQPAAPVVDLADERARRLPVGAEAALRSIVEVRPDPRNTLVFQQDPTAEVRLTTAERSAARDARERRSA